MEHRNPKKTHAMLRFDLMIAGALALAVGLFALLYSGGGVAILTAAATEDNGEEQYPSGSPLPEVSPTPPSPTPSQAPVSTEGRLIPYMENGLWGYKNTKGEVAIEPRFSAACEFDGATAFAAENGYYGLLAKNGIWIVEPIWEAVEAFSEGRAAVESGGKWGFIDENGTLVIDYKFREVGSFHCGRAIARSAASYGYIDVNGDIAVSQKWTAAGDFSEDVAFVRSESDNSYIIDKVGEKIATLSSRQYGSPFCEGFIILTAAVKPPLRKNIRMRFLLTAAMRPCVRMAFGDILIRRACWLSPMPSLQRSPFRVDLQQLRMPRATFGDILELMENI